MIWTKGVSIWRLLQDFIRLRIGIKIPSTVRFQSIHPVFIVKITLILNYFHLRKHQLMTYHLRQRSGNEFD